MTTTNCNTAPMNAIPGLPNDLLPLIALDAEVFLILAQTSSAFLKAIGNGTAEYQRRFGMTWSFAVNNTQITPLGPWTGIGDAICRVLLIKTAKIHFVNATRSDDVICGCIMWDSCNDRHLCIDINPCQNKSVNTAIYVNAACKKSGAKYSYEILRWNGTISESDMVKRNANGELLVRIVSFPLSAACIAVLETRIYRNGARFILFTHDADADADGSIIHSATTLEDLAEKMSKEKLTDIAREIGRIIEEGGLERIARITRDNTRCEKYIEIIHHAIGAGKWWGANAS